MFPLLYGRPAHALQHKQQCGELESLACTWSHNLHLNTHMHMHTYTMHVCTHACTCTNKPHMYSWTQTNTDTQTHTYPLSHAETQLRALRTQRKVHTYPKPRNQDAKVARLDRAVDELLCVGQHVLPRRHLCAGNCGWVSV